MTASAAAGAIPLGRTAEPGSVACKICGGPSPLAGVADFNKHCPVPGDARLPLSGVPVYYRHCAGCGFFFTDQLDRWTDADFLAHIYNERYREIDPDYVELRPRNNANLIAHHFGAHRDRLSCLDFGGGDGRLAALLRDAGFTKARSYDPFTPGADVLPAERFDLVTSFEVLEHVPDPKGTVAALANAVAEDGMVLFSTLVLPADFASQGTNWWYVAPRNGHISLYSRRALALMWEALGFTFGSFNDNLHVAWRRVPSFAAHLVKSN
jgi:SAM-dependent methyltransferase